MGWRIMDEGTRRLDWIGMDSDATEKETKHEG